MSLAPPVLALYLPQLVSLRARRAVTTALGSTDVDLHTLCRPLLVQIYITFLSTKRVNCQLSARVESARPTIPTHVWPLTPGGVDIIKVVPALI